MTTEDQVEDAFEKFKGQQPPQSASSTRSSSRALGDSPCAHDPRNTLNRDEIGMPESVVPTLMTLPSEIRGMILRHVLGDRTVHVYYKLQLQYENGGITAKVSDPWRSDLRI